MRTFTHAGDRYLLGQSEFGYGIWQIGHEHGEPVAGFPTTPDGWNRAVAEFVRIQPDARPIGPSPAQPALPVPVSASTGPALYTAGPVAAPTNGMATVGGTVGIVGAVLSLVPLVGIAIGLVMGTLAIIFSGIGLSRAGRSGLGRGLATTGLVLGILTVIFKLIPGVDLL